MIKLNRIKCRYCRDVIISEHRHDFNRCKCGAVYVDGGKDYLKRGGEPSAAIEMSIYEEDDE